MTGTNHQINSSSATTDLPNKDNMSQQNVDSSQGKLMKKEKKRHSNPRTHLYEIEQGWHLVVALPGIKQDHISLEAEGHRLQLTAEGDTVIYERAIDFPQHVEWEEINASWKAGLLQVTLEKAKPQRKQIKVQSA